MPVDCVVVLFVTIVRQRAGCSGGSLAATPDCKPVIPGSIRQSPQPTVDCQPLDGLPSRMVLHCRLSSEGRQRRINTKKGLWSTKKKLMEKKLDEEPTCTKAESDTPDMMLPVSL